ncbi:hypothetical protein K438DRAFT_1711883 [Mycena galopus ATCC 62051]|nr:hypothetical protein K438DRAFT_1711883 [Mycena galopus ATCC 62051]
MAVANAEQWQDNTPGALFTTRFSGEAAVSPHLMNFRHSWEGFIDSLLREWKTQNVVAALMLSAILTMLQIDAAAADPIARTTAILSLISALMSLLFGSMYIMRFGTMRKMYKAASWADEAQKGRTSVLWNVWIMLAIPAIWLAWSIVLFVTCIMAFTWRTGATTDSISTAISQNAARGLRIGVSALLAVALVYFFLIVKMFRKYGDGMDRRWNKKVIAWAQEGRYLQIGANPGAWEPSSLGSASPRRIRPSRAVPSNDTPRLPPRSPVRAYSIRHDRRSSGSRRSRGTPPISSAAAFALPAFDRPFSSSVEMMPFAAVKIMDLRYNSSRTYPMPSLLQTRDILLPDWLKFTAELEDVWNGTNRETPPFPIEVERGVPPVIGSREWAAGLLHLWNKNFFYARSAEAVICCEEPTFGTPGYAVYLIHWSPHIISGDLPVPEDYELKAITVIRLVEDPNGWQWGTKTRIDANPTQPDEDGAHHPHHEPDAQSSRSGSVRRSRWYTPLSPATQTRNVADPKQVERGAHESDAQSSRSVSVRRPKQNTPSTSRRQSSRSQTHIAADPRPQNEDESSTRSSRSASRKPRLQRPRPRTPVDNPPPIVAR